MNIRKLTLTGMIMLSTVLSPKMANTVDNQENLPQKIVCNYDCFSEEKNKWCGENFISYDLDNDKAAEIIPFQNQLKVIDLNDNTQDTVPGELYDFCIHKYKNLVFIEAQYSTAPADLKEQDLFIWNRKNLIKIKYPIK